LKTQEGLRIHERFWGEEGGKAGAGRKREGRYANRPQSRRVGQRQKNNLWGGGLYKAGGTSIFPKEPKRKGFIMEGNLFEGVFPQTWRENKGGKKTGHEHHGKVPCENLTAVRGGVLEGEKREVGRNLIKA